MKSINHKGHKEYTQRSQRAESYGFVFVDFALSLCASWFKRIFKIDFLLDFTFWTQIIFKRINIFGELFFTERSYAAKCLRIVIPEFFSHFNVS